MKTYHELIIEVVAARKKKKPFDSDAFDARQKARYGSSMAKAAADALAAAQKRKAEAPSKKPYPWFANKARMTAGWWHPTKEWFTFGFLQSGVDGAGYHITHMVRNLSKFGISQAELMKAAEEEAKRDFWDNEGRAERGYSIVDAQKVIRMVEREEIDNSWPLINLAYNRGWLRVYGGKFHTGSMGGTLDGNDKKSIKAAIREIEREAEMQNLADFRVDVSLRGKDPNDVRIMSLASKMRRDAFMQS